MFDLKTFQALGRIPAGKANPWDNAACESFMKTLKGEEVYRTEYRDQAQRRSRLATIEVRYEFKRSSIATLTIGTAVAEP